VQVLNLSGEDSFLFIYEAYSVPVIAVYSNKKSSSGELLFLSTTNQKYQQFIVQPQVF
jgi:hypothetical protein